MPFRSGLIIYYGKRFCCDKQYHNKYNILSNKMSFGDNDKKQSPRRNKTFDNRVRKTPGTFYSTLGKASSDLKFFNLISKFTNLRRCTLLICLDLTDPKNKKFRKEINRLFRQSKRLSALHVYLYNFGDVSHSNQGHFRGIRMLTALKYLEFLSAGYNISIFQKMCPFIERRTNRNYWKRLKSCRLILNPKINMAHEFTFQQEMATFLEVLKKIDEWQDRINVAQELKLYIDQKDHLDRYFAENELFNNCTSLRALDLKGNINTCFQHFFANHYQHVEDLCLEIKKTQAHERLSEITETLSSFANLKILDLNIADVLESHQLEKIFNNMKKNSMLTDFKLHLKEINAPINSFPDMLMATKNLKVFHLEVTKLNNVQFPLEEFFQSISQLFRLKELTIHMEYSSQIDDDLFEVLCESLKNLRSLELLSLNFLENKISSKGLNHLTQVMPYLLNLQTFFINLKEGYALDENSASNFMWSLESLRFLETLTIELSLIEFTNEISRSIIESIESLKCLYFVKLNLGRVDTSKGFELERKTRGMIMKLEHRIHEIRFFFN